MLQRPLMAMELTGARRGTRDARLLDAVACCCVLGVT